MSYARKLDKFKGKVDFKNDSPDKIRRVLNELKSYLSSYSEDEAAEIIGNLQESGGGIGGSNKKSQKERIQDEQFLKAYKERTTVLDRIRKSLGKIQDDLIDEQDTKIARGPNKKWESPKVKEVMGKIANAGKEALDMLKNPLQWLKDLIFGALLGKLGAALMGMLATPIGALVTSLIGGAFAVGKWGFKLVTKLALSLLKVTLKAALAIGGWAFKMIGKAIGKAWDKWIKPKLEDLGNSFIKRVKELGKSAWESAKGAGKKVFDKGKELGKGALNSFEKTAAKAWEKVGKFFGSAEGKVKGTITQGWNTTKKAAEAAYNSSVKYGKAAATKVSQAAGWMSKKATAQWGKLKDKVKSIGEKLTNYFKKSSGKDANKAAGKLAMRLPKALSKFASKFLPGVGLALLAYDVYHAAKKSSGVVSFAVNLIDGVTGGLLSVGLGSVLDDFDGENLGEYVSNAVKGLDLGLSGSELNILDGINMNALEANGNGVTKKLNDLSSVGFKGSSESFSKIEKSMGNNPNKQAVVNEYKRLVTLVQSGQITEAKASSMFKEFANKTLGSELATNSLGQGGGFVDSNGVQYDSGGGVQVVKNSETNIVTHDVGMATQAQMAMATMKASMMGAVSLAGKVASNISTNVVNIAAPTVPPMPFRQTVVQG